MRAVPKRKNLFGFGRPDARRTTPAHGGIAYHQGKMKGRAAAPAKRKAAVKEAGGSAMPDEATLQAGFKRGLSLSDMLRRNPSTGRWHVVSNNGEFLASFGTKAAAQRWVDRLKKLRLSTSLSSMGISGPVRIKDTGKSNPAAAFAGYLKGRGNPGMVKYRVSVRKVSGGYRADIEQKLPRVPYWDEVQSTTAATKAQARKDAAFLISQYRKEARGNPAAASAEVFEEFHGYAPKEVVTVTKRVHYHENLAGLGDLIELGVWGVDGTGHTIKGFKKAILCSNEDRSQLFIEGGDQRINLKDFGIRPEHETETLGAVVRIVYFTTKTHLGDEGGTAAYDHRMRATNRNGKHVTVKLARYPDLIYDVRNEQLLFSGGSYEILREGINK